MFAQSQKNATIRGLTLVMIALLALALLASCGGDDDDDGGDDPFPTFSGADEIATAEPTQEDLADLNADVIDAGTTLLRVDEPFDEVAQYYSEDVEDDGWLVNQDVPLDDEQLVVVLTNDTRVAAVYVLSGAAAKEGEELFADEGLEFDPEDVDDEDSVILVSHFTCQESTVAECLVSFAP
jgi:hypothetical protein